MITYRIFSGCQPMKLRYHINFHIFYVFLIFLDFIGNCFLGIDICKIIFFLLLKFITQVIESDICFYRCSRKIFKKKSPVLYNILYTGRRTKPNIKNRYNFFSISSDFFFYYYFHNFSSFFNDCPTIHQQRKQH